MGSVHSNNLLNLFFFLKKVKCLVRRQKGAGHSRSSLPGGQVPPGSAVRVSVALLFLSPWQRLLLAWCHRPGSYSSSVKASSVLKTWATLFSSPVAQSLRSPLGSACWTHTLHPAPGRSRGCVSGFWLLCRSLQCPVSLSGFRAVPPSRLMRCQDVILRVLF